MSKQTPAKLMRSPSYFDLVHPYVGETHSNSDFTSFSGMYRNYQQHVSWSTVSTPARRQSSALSASKETKVIVQNRNYHALSQANILPIHEQRIRAYNFNNVRYGRRRYIIQQQPAREKEDEKEDEKQRETLEKEQSSMDGKLLVVDSKLTESQLQLQNNNNNNNNNSNNITTITPITIITTSSTTATNKESEQLRNAIEIIPLASFSTFFAEVTDAENVKSNNANANAAVVDAVGKSSNISVLEKATTTTPTQTPQSATPTSRQILTNNEMIVQRSFPMFEILPSLITSRSKKQSLLYQNSYLLDGIKYENNSNKNDSNNKDKQSQTKCNVNANKNQKQYQDIQENSKLKLDYKKIFKSLTTKPKPTDGDVIFGNAKVLRTNLNGWEHSRISWLLELEQQRRDNAHRRKHQRKHQRHSNMADANKRTTFGNAWDYDANNENVMQICCCCLPFMKALLS